MKFAFVFPGQGSQSVGMMEMFAAEYGEVGIVFAEASEALGYDLWKLVQEGPAEQLNQTEYTQPAMLAAGVATWRVYLSLCDEKPAIMAGHSLGEYSALVCSDAIAFWDAVKLVAERGRLMQSAVPEGQGAMAAVLGLDDDVVIRLCEQAADAGVVQAVNFNSPGQVVIAGQSLAVEKAMQLAQASKAKRVMKLPVSVPSHSRLMMEAAEQLAGQLAAVEIKAPAIPVINNVSADSCDDADGIRDALMRQLYNPVLWVDSVKTMISRGAEATVECGPGKVLAGLNKRIDKAVPAYALDTPDAMTRVIDILK